MKTNLNLIAGLLIATIVFIFTTRDIVSSDLWFGFAYARDMLAQKAYPLIDSYSYVAQGRTNPYGFWWLGF